MNGRVARWCGVIPAMVVGLTVVTAGPASAQSEDEIDQADVDGLASAPVAADEKVTVAVPPDPPPRVEIRVDVAQILEIDVRRNRFGVDAVLTARWVDKRAAEGCIDEQIVYHADSAVEVLKTEVWAPQFVVVDGRGPRKTTALELSVTCEGIVRYQERFATTVTQRFTNLHDFPFDEQVVRFEVAPFGRGRPDAIEFVALDGDEECEPRAAQKAADKFEADEWNFEALPCALTPSPPSITAAVRIHREVGYYWMNIILPLSLIVAISWIVFWMKPVLHERLGVSLTVLLTIVAFDFLTGDSLPRLPFTTRMDQFYNVSYLFVAATILVSFFATRGQAPIEHGDLSGSSGESPPVFDRADDSGRPDQPVTERDRGDVRTIDRLSRYAFPPAYTIAVVLAVVFGVFSTGRGEAPDDPAGVDSVPEVETDGPTELTSQVPTSTGRIDDDNRSDQYQVCGLADDVVSVRMDHQPDADGDETLDPFLKLFLLDDGTPVTFDDETPVTFDDDGGGGLDSLLVLPADECYVLIASDATNEGIGDYEVTLGIGEAAAIGVDFAAEFSDIEGRFGRSFDALSEEASELTPGTMPDQSIDERGDVRSYRVCSQGEPGGFVTMTRSSDLIGDALDPLLVLYDLDGELVAFDDDGAGGLDSLLDLPPGIECRLLVAGDLTGEAVGKFTIGFGVGEPPVVDAALAFEFEDTELLFDVAFDELLAGATLISPDEVVTGSIDEDGEVASFLVCSNSASDAVVVMERSESAVDGGLDPWLTLYAEDGSFLDFDDDGAGGLDSRIELPAGEDCYLVVAADLSGEATGEYRLTVTGR